MIGHGVALARIAFFDITDIEGRKRGQQLEHPPRLIVFFRHLGVGGARGATLVKLLKGQLRQLERRGAFLVGADLGALFQIRDAPLQAFQIRQHQFGLDDVEIGQRINAPFDMGDVAVFETARHEGHRVTVPNIGQKLIAQPLALGGAAHQTRHIDEGDARRNDLF